MNKYTPTRYPNLRIVQRDRGLWRFNYIEDGYSADVGPHMATKAEAYALLDEYAKGWGY